MKVVGILMIVLGVILGLYIGIWVCFIGGIVNVIQAIRAEHLIAMDIGIGVAKIVCAGLAGWGSACILILPGWFMIEGANPSLKLSRQTTGIENIKCENCNKIIGGESIYGYGNIKWCNKKCWDEGLKRLARQKMTKEEIKLFDYLIHNQANSPEPPA